jgi:hypothetical protein
VTISQRFGQSRLGQSEHSDGVLAVDRPAGDRLLGRGSLDSLVPHRLKLAWRSGQHDHRRLSGHYDARCGSYRVEHLRTDGNHGLFAVGGADRVKTFRIEVRHKPFENVGDLAFNFFVERQLALTEARHHLDGHVIGRRTQAAAGYDQVHALVGHET